MLQEITGRNNRNITAYYRANGQLVAQQEYITPKSKSRNRYRHRPHGRLEYYAHDGLGSVVALTNHRGKINTQLRYDVYGSPVVGKLDDNPYGFNGKRFDPESGLYQFHFRAYDPATGVWTTEDPIRIAGGINLYGYVRNDPVNWIDVYGLIRWGDLAAGVGVTVAGAVTALGGGALTVGLLIGEEALALPSAGATVLLTTHTIAVGGIIIGTGVTIATKGVGMIKDAISDESPNQETEKI